MKTRVFISWSGTQSKAVAEVLRTMLPAVLQNVEPFFSPDDIQKGQRWSIELAKELDSSSVGILCVTRENRQAPWLLFEAGALSKQLSESRLCTVLVDIKPADLAGPLSQFQHTAIEKQDFKALFQVINSASEITALAQNVLDQVLEHWWVRLEADLKHAVATPPNTEKKEVRSDRELLEELLGLQRRSDSIHFPRSRVYAEIETQVEAVAAMLMHSMIGLSATKRAEFQPALYFLADILSKFPNSDETRQRVIQALTSAPEA